MPNILSRTKDKIINMNKEFSSRLKELRTEQNLSFEKLSQLTKISRATLCRYENNQTDVNGENLITLAKFFHVSTDYLLGLED